MMAQTDRQSGIFYGWWIVASCSIIGLFSSSSRFSFTMFFPTLLEDLGWSRAILGFGLTLHMWMYGITVIAVGLIVDRYGPRFIMTMGGVFILIGLTLTSKMTSVWQFYLYYGVILAIGVASTLVVPNLSTARKWFTKKAGLAVALTIIGSSMGLAVMSFVAPALIKAYGWRGSWLYLGLTFGVLTVIIAWIIVRKDPESMGLLPDGDPVRPSIEIDTEETRQEPSHNIEEIWNVRDAVRTRSFWLLIFGNVFSVFILMGILGHIAAWGVDVAKAAGTPVEEAMGPIKLCVFLMSIMSIAGSLVAGPLSDKIGRKAIICAGFALNAILFLYVSTIDSLTEVVIFGILAGTLGGFIVPLWAAYLGDIYGRASLATLFGILIFAGGMIGGCGPVVFGWIFDVTASYKWAWYLSTVCCLITLILVLLVKHETKKAHQL